MEDDVGRKGGRRGEKKISFQDRGNAVHSSRYLPMTQKSGILKDRRRFAFKKQAILPVADPPFLNPSLPSPVKLFRV